jgi:uncharacterized membrane protein
VSLHLAMVVFPNAGAAARALAAARARTGERPWMRETAVVERHRDGRELVHGAYHAASAGDPSPLSGGGLVSAVCGESLGPAGRVAGLLIGPPPRDLLEGGTVPRELRGAYIEELRAALAPGSSAILLLASPLVVDDMVATVVGEGARLLRRHLTFEARRMSPSRAALN